jgi:hypothetical protein
MLDGLMIGPLKPLELLDLPLKCKNGFIQGSLILKLWLKTHLLIVLLVLLRHHILGCF